MNMPARMGISAAAGIGAAVMVALVVAIVDLHLTGHGYGSITNEVITWAQAGVHLSIGDLAMLVTAATACSTTWYLTH
jgi:hypothetical protein